MAQQAKEKSSIRKWNWNENIFQKAFNKSCHQYESLALWVQLNVLLVEFVLEKFTLHHSFIFQNEKSNSIFKMNHFVFIQFNVLYIKLPSLLSLKPGSWINMNEYHNFFLPLRLSIFYTMKNYQKLVFAIHLKYFALKS